LTIQTDFHAAHQRTYGHAFPERTVEKVTLRVQAVGLSEKPTFTPEPLVENDGSNAQIGSKEGLSADGIHRIALYERELLIPGARFQGPALVFQLDCTTYIPPKWTAEIDEFFNINVRNSY
jgi:N-methylhydantoinase A